MSPHHWYNSVLISHSLWLLDRKPELSKNAQAAHSGVGTGEKWQLAAFVKEIKSHLNPPHQNDYLIT